jgi:hypothetical protein
MMLIRPPPTIGAGVECTAANSTITHTVRP